MSMDDDDGQMISGDLGGLKLPDICLTGEEKPRKNLTQETCPDRGSNQSPLRDARMLPLAPQEAKVRPPSHPAFYLGDLKVTWRKRGLRITTQ